MKRNFTKICLIAFAFIPVMSFGQVHLGLTTGVNSTFVLDKGISEDPRYNSTMTYNFSPIGFSVGLNLSDGFGLQLESILAKQGQIFEIIDVAKTVVGERKIDLEYIQLPLLFKFMSSGVSKTRANFSIGPQLSILTSGTETMQYAASTQYIGNEFEIPEGAVQNQDGSYDVPNLDQTEIMSTFSANELMHFKDKELQISGSFGVDIDLSNYLYLSTLIRANYSFTDMRNEDLIQYIEDNNLEGLIDKRATLSVGVQVGLSYMFGGVRSFQAKQATKEILNYQQ